MIIQNIMIITHPPGHPLHLGSLVGLDGRQGLPARLWDGATWLQPSHRLSIHVCRRIKTFHIRVSSILILASCNRQVATDMQTLEDQFHSLPKPSNMCICWGRYKSFLNGSALQVACSVSSWGFCFCRSALQSLGNCRGKCLWITFPSTQFQRFQHTWNMPRLANSMKCLVSGDLQHRLTRVTTVTIFTHPVSKSSEWMLLLSSLVPSSDSWRCEVLKPSETRGIPQYSHINPNKESSCSNGDDHEIGVPLLIPHHGLATSSRKKTKSYGFETAAPLRLQHPACRSNPEGPLFSSLFRNGAVPKKHISDSLLKELNSIWKAMSTSPLGNVVEPSAEPFGGPRWICPKQP